MALVLDRKLDRKGGLKIWKIEEPEDFYTNNITLSHHDVQKINQLHIRRKKEWLAGRYLLNQFHPNTQTITDEYGKPFLKDSELQVSLSHSGGFAAAIANDKIVGIDIQKVTNKIHRIAHKFLREEEKSSIDTTNALNHLHIFWGAKEALYKAYGKKELDFRKHIIVKPFEFTSKGSTKGYVQKGNVKYSFDVHFEQFNQTMLVYCLEE